MEPTIDIVRRAQRAYGVSLDRTVPPAEQAEHREESLDTYRQLCVLAADGDDVAERELARLLRDPDTVRAIGLHPPSIIVRLSEPAALGAWSSFPLENEECVDVERRWPHPQSLAVVRQGLIARLTLPGIEGRPADIAWLAEARARWGDDDPAGIRAARALLEVARALGDDELLDVLTLDADPEVRATAAAVRCQRLATELHGLRVAPTEHPFDWLDEIRRIISMAGERLQELRVSGAGDADAGVLRGAIEALDQFSREVEAASLTQVLADAFLHPVSDLRAWTATVEHYTRRGESWLERHDDGSPRAKALRSAVGRVRHEGHAWASRYLEPTYLAGVPSPASTGAHPQYQFVPTEVLTRRELAVPSWGVPHCRACSATLPDETAYCPSCGYAAR